MTPKPLTVPPNQFTSSGDIITIDGIYNRHPVASLAWWLMLIFSPPRAARHLGWAFRRKVTDELSYFPTTRRELFAPRQLQTFKVEEYG